MRGTRQPRSPSFLGILAVLLHHVVGASAAFDVVRCGQTHTCVLDTKYGSMKCWGYNNWGQTGDTANTGTNDPRYPMGDGTPFVDIDTKSGCDDMHMMYNCEITVGRKVLSIELGNYHTCAKLDEEQEPSIVCFGYNQHGQSSPSIPTNRTVKSVHAGYTHTCALLDDTSLTCWGDGGVLQAGVQDFRGRTVKQVTSFQSSLCGIFDDDLVRCWGTSNFKGALGTGVDTGYSWVRPPSTLTAVDLGTGRTAKKITNGRDFACAILDNDSVKCWGENYYGQCGYGDGPGWSPTDGWLPMEPAPGNAPMPPPPPPTPQWRERTSSASSAGSASAAGCRHGRPCWPCWPCWALQ